MKLRDLSRLLRRLCDAGAGYLALFIAVNLFMALLPPIVSLATKALVSDLERHGQSAVSAPTGALVLLGGSLMLSQIFMTMLHPLQFVVTGRVNNAHRERVARLAVTPPTIDVLEQPRVQNLIEACASEATSWVERTLGEGATSLAVVLCQYLGAIVSTFVLAEFSWWLAPTVLVPACLVAWLAIRAAARIRDATLSNLDNKRRFMYFAELSAEPSEGKEIRIFGLTDWVIAHGRAAMSRYRTSVDQLEIRQSMQRAVYLVLTGISLLTVFSAVGRAAIGHLDFLAAETAVLTCAWSVFYVVASTWNSIAIISALVPLRAYDELVTLLRNRPDAEHEPEPVSLRQTTSAKVPTLRFEQVNFAYLGTDALILDGFDLELPAGQLMALVGFNGAGKSTWTKLMTGLYRPNFGRITLDGSDIDELGWVQWRRLVTVVFQDFVRYQESIAQNIALGSSRPKIDREALTAAASSTGLDQVIARLKNGWDTPLSSARSGGVDLSGGQWQQVALTRALYAVSQGARIIVLDEPTAHLDVRTEFEVFEKLHDVRTPSGERVSVVLISHRLSSVRNCDRIVLLQDGRIAESGSHNQLMQMEGAYNSMFTIQAQRFTQEVGRSQ